MRLAASRIHWYADGVLNVSANCIDRHLPQRKDDVALVFEGDDPGVSFKVTYGELHEQVCRMANVLKAQGVQKGDRVTIYLPMIPLAAVAMLACARIGAVHSVVFGGFSPDSIAGRIQDCASPLRDHRRRGPARRQAGAAEGQYRRGPGALPRGVGKVLMVRWTGADVPLVHGRDIVWDDDARTACRRTARPSR